MTFSGRATLLTLLLCFAPLVPGSSKAGGQATASAPGGGDGSQLRVFLLTMGQGDAVWERFGHNALWIEDGATGESAAYNWGVFDFDQVDFYPRLIRGTMLYRLGVAHDPGAFVEAYRYENRQVWFQELALTPAQKAALLSFVEWNALPENVWYRYDYYRDNCSTRVRDALDDVLEGRIWAVAAADTTAYTYRWHTRRLLRDVPEAYLGIQFVLGPAADRPLTGWEEMFLPVKLMDWLRQVQVPDGEGGLRPLVMREGTLVESSRPPEPQDVPFALPWFLGTGLLWSGLILGLGRGRRAVGWGRRLASSAASGGWAILAALSGTLLLAAWLFTDHSFWYGNYNLFQANPFFLPLPAAYGVYLFRGRFPRWGRDLAVMLGLVALFGAALEIVPGLGEANGEILALTLPLNLSLAVSAILLYGQGRGAGTA